MKKITLLIALFTLSFISQAQIAPGSVAPDFTVTDINGVSHSLSTYLAAGKTVIMDVSATWCGPCWNYHNTKALEDVYAAYGPEGSDEVVVLFVEGDATTTAADLNGTGSNTQGDWVTNTPYPIIDGSNIGSLYQIAYFPTLFRICPNGLVSEINAGSASSIRTSINSNCGTLTGVQNHVGGIDSSSSFCTANGAPIAKVRNYGENTITTATLNLLENGTVVATKAFSGSIPRFVTRTITFDVLDLNPGANYTMEVADANATSVFNTEIASASMGVSVAAQATTNIVVKVYTDNYPTEISWNIKDSAGVTVATGGPYIGSASGGGADANTTKTQNVTLINNECYSINLLDSFGDGWGYGNTPHGLEVFNASNVSIFNVAVSNFGTLLAKPSALTTASLAVSGNFEINQIGLFPNPTTGVIYVNTEKVVAVDIIDVTGKVVLSASDVTKETAINLSGLQKGLYLAKIKSDNANTTEKVILN